MTYHLYCPYCQRYLGKREDVVEEKMGCPCGKQLKDIDDESSFFIMLDIEEQMKQHLNDETFLKYIQQHRFQREKINDDAYEDIYDGEVYQKYSGPEKPLSYWYNMSYSFNTDGFPVGGKSGKQSCWPIYLQINELPHKQRAKYMVLVAIYVGEKDPNMKIFMHLFTEIANVLST